MEYCHIEVTSSQSPKRAHPCGDVVSCRRDAVATTLVLADGIGSGPKAHIAATLCVSRLQELMRQGFTARQAFGAVVGAMGRWRDPDKPYAAFTLVRVLHEGEASVLSYDGPPPLLVAGRSAAVLGQRTVNVQGALVGESHCRLGNGDALLIVSDGITQAGLGSGLREGWTAQGVARFVSDSLAQGAKLTDVPDTVLRRARELWRTGGDDCSAVLLTSRPGLTVNLFTGPPSNPSLDGQTVERFMAQEGWKVVCGATTAKIVARALGLRVDIRQDDRSMLAPPRYAIDGIDLVSEGAITLNQVYNVLDEPSERFEEDSGVTELHQRLQAADRVNILLGVAANPANESIAFRQRGVLNRRSIVPLLADKLRQAGKLVTLEHV